MKLFTPLGSPADIGPASAQRGQKSPKERPRRDTHHVRSPAAGAGKRKLRFRSPQSPGSGCPKQDHVIPDSDPESRGHGYRSERQLPSRDSAAGVRRADAPKQMGHVRVLDGPAGRVYGCSRQVFLWAMQFLALISMFNSGTKPSLCLDFPRKSGHPKCELSKGCLRG